jgi:hypothetical protein
VTATMPVLEAAIALALLLLGVSASSAGSSDQYEDYRRSAYITLPQRPSPLDDITEVPRLRISFGERSYGVVMDTSRRKRYQTSTACNHWGQASSRIPTLVASWVVTPMTITGGNGTRVSTAPIPVLAVTQLQCMVGAGRCTPNEAPLGISMMGIGFGSRHDHQAQSGPDKNPFLNITNIEQGSPNVDRMRQGYIVTRQGIHIGLTSVNTQGGAPFTEMHVGVPAQSLPSASLTSFTRLPRPTRLLRLGTVPSQRNHERALAARRNAGTVAALVQRRRLLTGETHGNHSSRVPMAARFEYRDRHWCTLSSVCRRSPQADPNLAAGP